MRSLIAETQNIVASERCFSNLRPFQHLSAVSSGFLVSLGMLFALLCGLVGLGGAVFLIRQVLNLPAGNERMRQIAGAIQEGAKRTSTDKLLPLAR